MCLSLSLAAARRTGAFAPERSVFAFPFPGECRCTGSRGSTPFFLDVSPYPLAGSPSFSYRSRGTSPRRGEARERKRNGVSLELYFAVGSHLWTSPPTLIALLPPYSTRRGTPSPPGWSGVGSWATLTTILPAPGSLLGRGRG